MFTMQKVNGLTHRKRGEVVQRNGGKDWGAKEGISGDRTKKKSNLRLPQLKLRTRHSRVGGIACTFPQCPEIFRGKSKRAQTRGHEFGKQLGAMLGRMPEKDVEEAGGFAGVSSAE